MRKTLLLGMAFLAALPSPGVAYAGAEPQAIKAPAADAMAVAKLMSPRDILVAMELREFDKHFVASLRSDANLKSMDDEYPGLFDAMYRASRSLVAASTGRSVDQIHVSLARLIEANFTPADIAELSDFYRSPLGRKTIEQMAASADASQIYQRAVEDQDYTLTEDQIAGQVNATARKAVETFTPEEQAEMIQFMGRPSFLKLAKAQPAIQKILADKFNAPDPEFDKRIEEVMSTAIEQHIAASEKSKTKRAAD